LVRRELLSVAGAGAALLALSSVWAAAPSGKSGSGRAVDLALVVPDGAGTPIARIAERFAARVQARSNGSMQVSITYRSATTGDARATPSGKVEADAVRAVRSGSVELGLIPSHALVREGVTTLRALQAPFLITSSEVASRATSGRLAARLQAGLGDLSLTGLGLVPEGLLRPFGYLKPLERPADFAGVTIRSSPVAHEVLRTLGAHPVELDVEEGDTAVHGDFAARDDSRPTAESFPRNAHTSAGVVLLAKVDAFVGSSADLARLGAARRTVLRQAADDAHAETGRALAGAAAGAAFCRAGGTIVPTRRSALEALRAKAAPLLAAMRSDPGTGVLIGEIERLGTAGGTKPRPCAPTRAAPSGPSGAEEQSPEVRGSKLPPAGTYRRAFTSTQLRAAGAAATEAESNRGVTTLTLDGPVHDPRFAIEHQGTAGRSCRGRVLLTPDRLAELKWNLGTPCSGYIAFAWKLDGLDLVITTLSPHAEPPWLRKAYPGVWKLVDCAPFIGWPGPDPAHAKAPPCPRAHSVRPPPRVRGEVAYSPDGKRAVYESSAAGGRDGLVLVNVDGSGFTPLTENRATPGPGHCSCDSDPSFSPDGARVAFVRRLSDVSAALFVVNVDGTGLRRLTPWTQVAPEVDWALIRQRQLGEDTGPAARR
jgi:C4-dicarboxylate-binding protein DctP